MTRGDVVLAVSEHMRNYALKNYSHVDPEKIITLHGGISHSDFPRDYKPGQAWLEAMRRQYPETGGKRLVSLPGRVTRWKGHREFIDLLARLQTRADNVHGIIIGGGNSSSSYSRELMQLAEQKGVVGCLTFTGETAEIRDWMAVSEIVLNLSHDPPEALGRTVLEALSLGRPVLAWDHGGAGEILDHAYPQGKVPLLDMEVLTARTLGMLVNPEPVPETKTFGLEEFMLKRMAVYERLGAAGKC